MRITSRELKELERRCGPGIVKYEFKMPSLPKRQTSLGSSPSESCKGLKIGRNIILRAEDAGGSIDDVVKAVG